jgi:hypothetical protein
MVVIDFVGNHRIFVERLRALLSLGATNATLEAMRAFLESDDLADLPSGCSIDIELEVKALSIMPGKVRSTR